MNLLNKIKACKTMPELDELRLELVMTCRGDAELLKQLQKEFIKKKNQLNRVPLFDRTW